MKDNKYLILFALNISVRSSACKQGAVYSCSEGEKLMTEYPFSGELPLLKRNLSLTDKDVAKDIFLEWLLISALVIVDKLQYTTLYYSDKCVFIISKKKKNNQSGSQVFREMVSLLICVSIIKSHFLFPILWLSLWSVSVSHLSGLTTACSTRPFFTS